MKLPKTSRRHPLLMYERAMNRLVGPPLLFGICLIALWVWDYFNYILTAFLGYIVLGAGILALGLAVFIWIMRRMAYVQANPDHLNVITPFLRLKVSYRRVKTVHSSTLQQLFPPDRIKAADRRMVEPFYGKTVVVVELSAYPMSLGVMQIFLPSQMFFPKGTGFVLVTPDWMELSTDIDSALGAFRQNQVRRNKSPERYQVMR